MGGALVADASPGGGLTMRLRLPLAARRASRAVTRVLVVDDEPGLRRALAINLRARGYEVDVAADGDGRARRRGAPARPTSSCSTSACPTWTAPR